jgi:hypothetical protein
MRRAEIEREICRQNQNAEREAELDRIKAQLWRRFSAATREISGVAGKSYQATVQKIPEKLLPKGIAGRSCS